jgi:glutaredoxin
MKPKIPRAFQRHLASCVAVILVAGSSLAQAQTVYRIVGPDGKVTFSDKPPAAAPQAPAGGAVASSSEASDAGADAASVRLPFELSKLVRQYPVVLYSGKDCAPCNSGRNLLINRGIPFTEKTVENNASAQALLQISGQVSIPLLTIGSQQLKGFSETSWTQYISAAGYPERSVLPSNYKHPSPTPLAEAKVLVPASSTTQAKEASAPAQAERPETPVKPLTSGIRF